MQITPLSPRVHMDPDILWDGLCGDLAVTDPLAATNPAGLRAEQALATAVLICLMTDRRVDEIELPEGEANRGWPGDSFDLAAGEVPLGSKLWLLRRRSLSEALVLEAEDHAREAMQTLIDQGAFVRVDVSASADFPNNWLLLEVTGYGRSPTAHFNEKFAILWDQLDGVPAPLT